MNKTSKFALIICLGLGLSLLNGCARIVSNQTSQFAEGLSKAIQAQNDLAIVEAGAPAYLLLLEAMLQNNPEDGAMLLGSASLYSFYSNVFAEDTNRQQRLNNKALSYALKGACLKHKKLCAADTQKLQVLKNNLLAFDKNQAADLFTLGSVWASWLEANRSDWNAIAQMGKIKVIIERVVALDDKHEQAHLYLGVLNSLIPAAMGGKPELGREHFEKAIALSNNKNLFAKVLLARHYSRLVFNQELHHRLLSEVLADKQDQTQYTLSNQLARRDAQELLDSEADYF